MPVAHIAFISRFGVVAGLQLPERSVLLLVPWTMSHLNPTIAHSFCQPMPVERRVDSL